MDFASALEDLERTADQASTSGRGGNSAGGSSHQHPPRGGGGAGNRRGRPEDYPPHHQRRNQRPRHHSRDRGPGRHHHHHPGHRSGPSPPSNPLEQMRHFGYRVEPPPVEVPPPQGMGGDSPFHIAFLAICIDGLPYEHLWKAWPSLSADSNTKVSMLVHAKYPRRVQSEFVKQRLLVHPPKLGRGNSYADPDYVSHQPNWGSVQITRAMLDLLREAMVIGTPADTEKDPRFSKKRYCIKPEHENDTMEPLPPVDKFIFISETCVPVAFLSEFEEVLFGSPDHYKNPIEGGTRPEILPWHKSWVNARNRNTPGTPRNKYERDQFGDIHRMVPGQYRWKADQWMALSRPHAAAINGIDAHMRPGDQLWNSFTKISASDEMYFPTALAILQVIQDPKVVARIKEQQQNAATGGGDNKGKEGSSGSGVKEGKPKDVAETERDEQEATKGELADEDEKGEEKPEVTVETLSPTVVFKSVTYTDWSEGMRNPKSFFQGSKDLALVGEKARGRGSLLARKFIICPPSEDATGKAPEEMSGHITLDEWRETIGGISASVPLPGTVAALSHHQTAGP